MSKEHGLVKASFGVHHLRLLGGCSVAPPSCLQHSECVCLCPAAVSLAFPCLVATRSWASRRLGSNPEASGFLVLGSQQGKVRGAWARALLPNGSCPLALGRVGRAKAEQMQRDLMDNVLKCY